MIPDSNNWIKFMLKSDKGYGIYNGPDKSFIQKAFSKYGGKIIGDLQFLVDFLFLLDVLIFKSSKAYMLKEELVQ
ncbi:hypothetical protein ACUN24_20375 [Pedobacter sp. WC2501]|uniref:hypothetical protein n=1 Tax=Pedobacter sp. WC2501 TaxID=3461400 RepID=UPI004045FA5C